MDAMWNRWLRLNETLLNRQWFESDMEFVCLFDWLNMYVLWMRLIIYLISFTLSFFFVLIITEEKKKWELKPFYRKTWEPFYAGYMRI